MAESYGNTVVYAEEWATKLQDRLSEPTKWKDICRVEYTNSRTLHNPYLTDPTVQTGTRGSSYTMQPIVTTDESVVISNFKILPQFIDRADLAQSTFINQMEMADRQAVLLNETIEAAVYGDHANFTNFGDLGAGAVGLGSNTITVSATNIDDVIRGIKREIRVANGETLLEQKGGFIVWRPADLELLEGFMQANGFGTADRALNGGTYQGVQYMGMTHYSSNLLASGHVFAGVKGLYHLGILRATYGQVVVNDKDPGNVSGISVVSRVDYAGKAWLKVKPVLFDVNVA